LLVSTHYMDEAERCHRLAILEQGRLVANGSPRELMEALPGQVLLVECESARAAQYALAGNAAVFATAQIGASLRVLTTKKSEGKSSIQQVLADAGMTAQVIDTTPNLEDVFVAVTDSHEHQSQSKFDTQRGQP